jgi:hypothetical protein
MGCTRRQERQVRLIGGEALEATHVELSTSLVVRDSCAAPPAQYANGDTATRARFGSPTTYRVHFPLQTPSSGTHTQIIWLSRDIEAEVTALKARGVVFEAYDVPGLKTINDVAAIGESKGAWFKDSAGNLLALGQSEQPRGHGTIGESTDRLLIGVAATRTGQGERSASFGQRRQDMPLVETASA